MRNSRFKGIVLAALLLLGTAQAAHAILAAVSPQVGADGFPLWYQDANGLALQPCTDPTLLGDPCALAGIPGPPFDEIFYWSAGAGPTAVGADGSARLDLAVEGAFLNGPVAPGEQITFGRVRIRVDIPTGAPAGTWTIDHPFGQLVFTDVPAGPAIRGINFTSDIGCGAVPCDFALALQSGIGPFLSQLGPPAPPPGFIGDGATIGPITPGPNGAVLRIRGPGGIDVTEPNFVIVGRITAAVVGVPLTVEVARYSRTGATASVDVIAHSALDASVTVSSGPTTPPAPANPPLPGEPVALDTDLAGSFGTVIQPVTDLPTNVAVTATPALGSPLGPTTIFRPLVDIVTVTDATHNFATNTLTVTAASSDKGATPPTLTVVGFGPMTSGSLVVPGVVIPPGIVTVTSSAGGSHTHPVLFVGTLGAPAPVAETLTITAANFRRLRRALNVTGTGSVPGNVVTVHLGDAAGPVVGAATVSATGTWQVVRRPFGIGAATTVTAVSSGGATASAPIVRR